MNDLSRAIFSFLFIVASVAQNASACPLIEGLVNYNCDQVVKIAFVGDSIVTGVGDEKRGNHGGYVKRLRQHLPFAKVTNDGVPGITTSRLIRYLKTEFKQKRRSRYYRRAFGADVVIVDVGRNDYWDHNANPAITARNIRRISKILKRKRMRKNGVAPYVVVASLLPTNRGFQAGFIDATNNYLNAYNGPAMPLDLDFYSMPRNLLAGDGLHPSSAGYHWLTELIEAYVTGPLQATLASHRPDNDSDGVYDVFEDNIFQTDPTNPDTDEDTFTDGEELFQLLTNPLDPTDPQTEEDAGSSEDGEEGEGSEGADDGESEGGSEGGAE
jgi:lysophospholipase L1-like esterase